MDWTLLILAVFVLVALFLIKRASFVSPAVARQHLANGALVIDVRSPEEFRGGHVANAVNLPLDELRERAPKLVTDRNQVLLLYCLSGGRSAVATQRLKRLGYANVFNLGSLARAKAIVVGGGGRNS